MSEAVKELIDIVIKLRSDNGCDWDRKQTSESLTPHLIEEANEVVDAVLEKNSENLKEELGDLLLHVVFQAVIASEKKTFEFEDVVQQINEKLIKRHPHIFDKNYDGEDLSNAKNWELIKKSEKNRESILDGMPKSLSALIVAQRYQDKTGAVGFEWENFSQAMDKVDEELGELKQAINNNDLNNIEEEIGDLLITIVNLARFFDISADLALRKTNQKFLRSLPNKKGAISKVLIKCLEDGRNPFIANGSKIRDQSRKWNEADKIIKRWKDLHQFDVVNFILNYEQEYDHKGFNQVNDPILILNAYVSIIGSYIVKDYLDERTNPT